MTAGIYFILTNQSLVILDAPITNTSFPASLASNFARDGGVIFKNLS